MTPKLPSSMTLDEMVIGAETDPDVWADLALSPGSEDAWSRAVERRREIDRLAGLVEGRAWLATILLKLLRSL